MSVFDLREISPNNWQAKYHGNYGIYNIKVTIDGTKKSKFSCSCPSDYYPCKHIPMVEEAIRERIKKSEENDKKNTGINVDELLKNISVDELRGFIGKKIKYDTELKKSFLLEFSHLLKTNDSECENPYSSIISDALEEIDFDYEDYYYNDCDIEIDVLDQWFDKARENVKQKNYREAILICKACIEEYAEWFSKVDSNVKDYIEESYSSDSFEILSEIIAQTNVYSKELFDYCKSEMNKEKYDYYEKSEFHDLLAQLAETVNPDEFLMIQDNLLKEVSDKSSLEAKRILQRKINFYNETGSSEKAWEIIENNIQIADFRKHIVDKYIFEKRFHEAKKLINDFLSSNSSGYNRDWYKLLLRIAEKENDIPAIRQVSYIFIDSSFDEDYCRIYKSTFSEKEWLEQVDILLKHYNKNKSYFNRSVADLLVFENRKEQLFDYLKKFLTLELLETYHTHLPSAEQTIALFRKNIDKYANDNTGRNFYEYIARLFEKMLKVEGGKQAVIEMISNYKTLYKNRKAMIEIMNGFVAKHDLK